MIDRETNETVAAEDAVAERISAAIGRQLKRNRKWYWADYSAVSPNTFEGFPRVDAFYEVKCRTVQYKKLLISLSKVISINQLQKVSGVPAYIAVGFPNGRVMVWRVKEPFGDVVWWGRTDRGTAADIEPAIAIPISSMVELIPPTPLLDQQ